MAYSIGIDLGGTNIKFVAAAPDGTVLDHFDRATGDESFPRAPSPPGRDGNGGSPWAEVIREELQRMQAGRGTPAASIGLAAPGLPAPDGRSIASMPGRLQGLEGLDWTTFLGAESPVPVWNDTQAALIGEAWIGAAAGIQDAILLTLGTGVGGAILSGGRLLRGRIGRAGHLGHSCLDPRGVPDVCRMPGSLEECIGECSLQRRAQGRFASTRALVQAYEAGDPAASRIWLKSVYELACALGSFINILDPEVIVIGGGIARAGESLFGPLRRFLDEVEWQPGGHSVPIVPASLGEYAGALGAARSAMIA